MFETLLNAWNNYEQHGWELVPCRLTWDEEKQSKQVHAPKWKNKNNTLADIQNPSGIALKTGSGSRVLVVDVDVLLGKPGFNTLHDYNITPSKGIPTARTQSDGRHFFFKFPDTPTFRTTSAKPVLGIDVRGDGGLLFLPPSKVIGGGQYEWITEPDFDNGLPELSGDWLKMLEDLFPLTENVQPDIENRLANARRKQSVKQREIWEKELANYQTGNYARPDRSDMDWHLTCVGLEFGTPENEIEEALWFHDNAKARDRSHGKKYIDLTVTKAERKVGLKPWHPVKRNGSNGHGTAENLKAVDPSEFLPEEDEEQIVIPQLPEELAAMIGDDTFSACTFITEFEQYIHRYYPYAPPFFATLQGLTVLSMAAAGRVVVVTEDHVFPNIYTILIDGSGTGKSKVTNAGKEILRLAGLDHMISAQQESLDKMIFDMGTLPVFTRTADWDELPNEEKNSRLATYGMRENRLWDFDEMNETIASMLNRNSSDARKMEVFLSFEDPNGVRNFKQNYHANKERTKGGVSVGLPYLVVTGNAVPDRFAELGRKFRSLMLSGFFSRFLVACRPPDSKPSKESPPHIKGEERKTMEAMKRHLQTSLANYSSGLGYPKAHIVEIIPKKPDGKTDDFQNRYYKVEAERIVPKEIELSEKVYDLINLYEGTLRDMANEVDDLLKPLYNRFGRHVLKIAGLFASYDQSDVIEDYHFAHALRIAEQSRESMHNLVAANETYSQTSKYTNQELVLKTLRKLRKWTSRRDLSRKCRLSASEIETVLSDLIRDFVVEEMKDNSKPGRPILRYRARSGQNPQQQKLQL